jgi:hypothetical protein
LEGNVMSSAYELAQLNVAMLRAPLDSPSLSEFVSNVDRINGLAEESAGFVWRLGDAYEPAISMRPLGDSTLVNMSVWQDVPPLADYVHKSAHAEIMRRKREWFERMTEAHVVLWWVPAGHRPTVREAIERLELLQREGPSPGAFTFAKRFEPPDQASSSWKHRRDESSAS